MATFHQPTALAVAVFAFVAAACSPGPAISPADPEPASTTTAPVEGQADIGLPIVAIDGTAWTDSAIEDATHQAAADPSQLVAACADGETSPTGQAHATTGPAGTSVTFSTADGIVSCDAIDGAGWCTQAGWGGTAPYDGLVDAGRATRTCVATPFLYVLPVEGASYAAVTTTTDGTFTYPAGDGLPLRVRAEWPAGQDRASATVSWYAADGALLAGPEEIRGYVAG